MLWSTSQQHRTAASISAAALACVATTLLSILLHFEHRRSTSSSAFTAVWLVASLLCDGAIARSCYLRPGLQSVGSLLVCAAVLKLIITVLEEWPKTNFVKDSNTGKPVARESTGGFWNRNLVLWLNKTLFSGYRFVISMDDLDELDADLKSSTIAATFQEHWAKGKLVVFVSRSLFDADMFCSQQAIEVRFGEDVSTDIPLAIFGYHPTSSGLLVLHVCTAVLFGRCSVHI